MFDNSDDFQFTPSMNQHLSNLFADTENTNDADHNLCYTAPKQPRPIPKTLDIPKENSPPKANTTVICASIINLWKLEDNKYNSIGNYGIAIISSTKLNVHEIILYEKRDNITSRTKLHEGFTLTHQREFLSFYDNNRQNWLIKFKSNTDKTKFTSEIEKFGGKNVFKENQKVSVKERSSPDLMLQTSPLEHKDDSEFDVLNSDSSGSKKRANILSRMAKMGQSMLPQTKTDISDTDEEEKELRKDVPKKLKQKNKKPLNKIPLSSKNSPDNNQLTPDNFNIVQVPHQFSSTSTFMLDPINVMFAENRTHNSEIRINLNQISSKLDNVMKMIETNSNSELKTSSNNEDVLKMKLKALELQSENLTTEIEKYEEKHSALQKKFNEQKKIAQTAEEKLKATEEIIKIQTEQLSEFNLKKSTPPEDKEVGNYKKIIEELEKKVEYQSVKLKDLEEFYEENKDAPTMKNKINELKETIVNIKQKMQNFEDCDHVSECDTERIEEELRKSDHFIETLKRTMNTIYNTTVEEFNEKHVYSSSEINNIVAKYIKIATFKIIEDFKTIYTKPLATDVDN